MDTCFGAGFSLGFCCGLVLGLFVLWIETRSLWAEIYELRSERDDLQDQIAAE